MGVYEVAFCQPQYIPMSVTVGTNATIAYTDTCWPIGNIDEIIFQSPTRGNPTSDVCIICLPAMVTNGINGVVLYTNAAMTSAANAWPRITPTDNTGTALTSLTVRERFLCNGDPVTFRVAVTNADVTGVTFRCWIKIDN